MSLQQLHESLLTLGANSVALSAALPKIFKVWPDIKGGSYPLPLAEFTAQVAASAPEGAVVQQNLKRLSMKLGASGQGALNLLLGAQGALQYATDLKNAEDFGGYGGDGGSSGPSSAARQGAGAQAGLRLAGLAVSEGREHGKALLKEKDKMPSLDEDTLTALSAAVADPPTIGDESSGRFTSPADHTDISLNSIYFWGSGDIFIFYEKDVALVFKVSPP